MKRDEEMSLLKLRCAEAEARAKLLAAVCRQKTTIIELLEASIRRCGGDCFETWFGEERDGQAG